MIMADLFETSLAVRAWKRLAKANLARLARKRHRNLDGSLHF